MSATILKPLTPILSLAFLCWQAGHGAPARAGAEPARPAPAQLFAEGVVSTAQHEWTTAFSPADDLVYFSVSDPNFVSASRYWTIVYSHFQNGFWTPPQTAPFSGRFSDAYPAFAVDGSRLYFSSNRSPDQRAIQDHFDIWFAKKQGDGWSEPQRLGHPVNTEADEFHPSLTAAGTLYFTSNRSGNPDIYRSPGGDGGYRSVEKLRDAINSPRAEIDPYVDPEERFLLFAASGRPDSYGSYDLYLSKREQGAWLAARNLGSLVNSSAQELAPHVPPDGGNLFFTSRRGFRSVQEPALTYDALITKLDGLDSGSGNIYYVAIESLAVQRDGETAARAPEVPPAAAGKPPPYAAAEPLPTPRLFGENIISTPQFEGHPEWTPDGRELYFTINSRDFSFSTIAVSRFEHGRWQRPRVAAFSGRYPDGSTGISADGSKLYFSSRRPKTAAGAPGDFDLWMVERQGDGWGPPRRLAEPVNSPAREFCPSIAADGTLYFVSTRPGGFGRGDLYRTRLENDIYREPENLGPAINTPHHEGNVYITPDQDYILFMAAGRLDSFGGDDIYISRRRGDTWEKARNLGTPINSQDNDFSPKLSPDRKYLFFASNRFDRIGAGRRASYGDLVKLFRGVSNGAGNIYQVDFDSLTLE